MVRANRIPIKAVNKVQYQWGKYCMINVCSMDMPWMSLPFFLSFNPLAPNYFPYNFYDSEMFFHLVVSMGPRRHCFLTRTQDFFFLPRLCTRQDTKKFHNYNDTFLFNFQLFGIGSTNTLLIDAFLYSHYFLA